MQTHNIIVPCLQCTKKTPGSKEPFHGWRNVRPRAKACLQVVQITAFNFCNHMFKNSRKRYRDRRKRYTYPACTKTNQIVAFDTIHKNKRRKNSSPQVFTCTYWVSSETSSRSNIRSSLSSNLVLKILLWILVIL